MKESKSKLKQLIKIAIRDLMRLETEGNPLAEPFTIGNSHTWAHASLFIYRHPAHFGGKEYVKVGDQQVPIIMGEQNGDWAHWYIDVAWVERQRILKDAQLVASWVDDPYQGREEVRAAADRLLDLNASQL